MFNFKPESGWSLEIELECFVIYKQLESKGFPYGLQSELCDKLAERCKLDSGTLKAKVGNFKSEFGNTEPTHSSKATKYIAMNYGSMSLKESEALLTGYQLAVKATVSY
ncbi:hypothetical protein N474_14570 [Pseudoalteromonas luteoviolacea CPMOR-2]|uniref:Uncharacterized protein n=1 Tax=Pseudoalteromonas luteoviolacea DSM 6061 TaxID=1365250 RepID=A0A166VHU3_9GAMM|nr:MULTISPECIES: hypothetical protein [Pseudoalteromonas]KZN32891.1 hypothetical protein N475_20440 [Pseudoalteromonas luteoviolacea DSM 6061]KZN55768.1 hypothetical protein N474_14570 [Pseudoalteromonas luteoviolacea CPMOR-2]MBE0385393.1 hypothetical protein [Pseudoalteromonas luteoviolacea DSM 6061]MCG7551659.1 hypothetical protein [Pseudoalteromonas sp. Of7M-16]